MSTKTLRKRIALVAVSAMGFGLLTSVSAHAGVTALADDTGYMFTTSTTPGTAPTANLGSKSFGIITTDTGTGTAVAAGAVDAADYAHIKGAAGKTASATVYQNAEITFSGLGAAGNKASIVLSAGQITNTAGAPTVNGASTQAVSAAATAIGVTVKPTGVAAGSTFTVAVYTGANVSTTAPTNGVLAIIYTITVASASAAGTVSLADSTVTQQAGIAAGVAASTVLAYDTTTRMQTGKVGIIYIALKDKYLSAITSGTLAATATNGSYVNVVTNAAKAAADSYAATTAFDTAANSADGKYYVYVTQPAAYTAGTTTVTLTLDGAAIGTKTLNWAGDIAKIIIDKDATAKTFVRSQTDGAPAGSLKNVTYVVQDAAGNAVEVTSYPTVANATGAFVGATAAAGGDAAGSRALQTAANGYGTTTILTMSSDLSGTGTFQLKLTNAQGASIYSDAWTGVVSTSATPYTFTASFDKTTYAPGSIATLTIEPKDSLGNAVAYGAAATGLVLSVNSDGLAAAGTACSAASTYDVSGKLVCKYAVKNAVGSYVTSVELTTGSAQGAVSITTNVASSSSTVTNAEVLAAIVKLIASINKQIAALQKALKK